MTVPLWLTSAGCMVAAAWVCDVDIMEVSVWLFTSREGFHEILLLNTSNSLKVNKQKLNIRIYNSSVRGSKRTYFINYLTC